MMRLSTKMLLFNLLGKGLILLLFIVAAPKILQYYALRNTDKQLLSKREQVLDIIREEGMVNFFEDGSGEDGFGSYNILKEEYILLEKISEPFYLDSIYTEDRILDNVAVTYRVSSFMFEFEEEFYLLEIGRSLQTIQDIESIVFRILYFTVFGFLVLTIFLDAAFNKWIMKPLLRLVSEKLSQIKEPQQFSHQPLSTNTAEFRVLDDAIGDMMKRIQKAFNQEREFISHASHELKTPISVLQSKIEVFFASPDLSESQMQKLMDMQSTVQEMKKVVNSLLLISKVNNAQFVKDETIHVDKLLADIHEEWEIAAEEKKIKLQFHAGGKHMWGPSNVSLFRIMIQNALTNALKYAGESTRIDMRLMQKSGHLEIQISDQGPGIPKEIMEQIQSGTVFLKDAQNDRSGFGLLLMHKIALFLGIQVQLESDNKGTLVSFLLPTNN
jgi:signal transduction histidine kinase